MAKIVLATGNQGKVKELAAMLGPFDFEVVPQSEFQVFEAEETGTTFVENAIIKARNAAQATGFPAIADDSGLAVDFLGGQPGIYSARYAGHEASDEENVHKLLNELHGVPQGQRTARFHCVLVYMAHAGDPTPLICHGVWEGLITDKIAGENGFGYDPVFYVPEYKCTSAQLSREVKNRLSHRGQALSQLVANLVT